MININDLPEAIISDALLFADDTKLFRQITSREDAHILQCDIDSLREWSEKCHVLTFENIIYTHNMYGNELEPVFEEKDLGVTIRCRAKIRRAYIGEGEKSEYDGGPHSPKFLVSKLTTI